MHQKKVGFYGAAFLWMPAAQSAQCAAGYYLDSGACKECNPGYQAFYCPGDDTRHPCPVTNTDYEKLSGWKKIKGDESWWAALNGVSAGYCYGDMDFQDANGNIVLIECSFNGENYWCDRRLWYVAGPGFYLSNYVFSSSDAFYSSVRECTNRPANAHYTGPGTPDAPDGSVRDANDCPWECDAGYGKTAGGECVPLCNAGVTKIHAGGAHVPLFNERHTAPALVVGYAGRICYADLITGYATGAININIGGVIYHTVQ